MAIRQCSRTACTRSATATLTYSYAESTAVLGPLAPASGGHDLCADHAARLSVPRGWDVIDLPREAHPAPPQDDLLALADAIREVGTRCDDLGEPDLPSSVVVLASKGHLRMIADQS